MIGYALRHRSLRAVLGLVPHIVLMIGLFMSHVNGLLRYGYPLIAATPLIGGYTFYAVSRKRAAPLAAPAASAPASPLPVLSGFRSLLARAFGKLTRLLKGAIRKICYFVLHLVEDKKE